MSDLKAYQNGQEITVDTVLDLRIGRQGLRAVVFKKVVSEIKIEVEVNNSRTRWVVRPDDFHPALTVSGGNREESMMSSWVVYQHGKKVDLVPGKTWLVFRSLDDETLAGIFLGITIDGDVLVRVHEHGQTHHRKVHPEMLIPKLDVKTRSAHAAGF